MIDIIYKLLYPPKCIFCNKIIHLSCLYEVCESCLTKLHFYKNGLLNFNPIDNIKYCDGYICTFHYSGIIKESLLKYKFGRQAYFFRTYTRFLADKLYLVTNYVNFDIIISVPIFYTRQKERGYNQSYLISKEISKLLKIPEMSNYLLKIRNTSPQSLLSKEQRKSNIKDAFAVSNHAVLKNKKVLLIDDIITTGSTIDECSKVLKKAGASSVYAAVVASGKNFF